jgi:hypothetical protein
MCNCKVIVLTPNPMDGCAHLFFVYYLLLGDKEGQESLGAESQ